MKRILTRAFVVGTVVLGVAACSTTERPSQTSHGVSSRVVSPSKPEPPSMEESLRAKMDLDLKRALSSESAIFHKVKLFGTCAGRYAAFGDTDRIPDKEGLKSHIGNLMQVGAFFATEYAKRGPSPGVSQTRLAYMMGTLEKMKDDAETSTRTLIEEGLENVDRFGLTMPCKKNLLLMVKVMCFTPPNQPKSSECMKN